jgi:tRNA (cmo5U34)-methyltransferase
MKDDFEGKLGKDYDVFTKVFTYYDQLEENVASLLSHETSRQMSSVIDVLEIGCGTGITTERILKVDPRIHVTAIDISPAMIEQAKNNLREYVARRKVKFVEQDALDYLTFVSPFSDKLIDYVVSVSTIHNIPRNDRSALYTGIYRSLRIGGAFINGDKIAQDDPEEHERCLSYDLALLDKMVELGRPDLKTEWAMHYLRDNQEDFILREGEFVRDLRAAGFADIRKIYRQYTGAVIMAVEP